MPTMLIAKNNPKADLTFLQQKISFISRFMGHTSRRRAARVAPPVATPPGRRIARVTPQVASPHGHHDA